MVAVVVLLLAATCLASADQSFLEGTELVFTFMVHRHGDRTPLESNIMMSTDPEKLLELTEPYGYGQLTKQGRIRGYELGEHIRSRYDGFLSPEYNRSEVYIRSTDSTRTKMTVLAAMAAVYPPGPDSWSQEIHWTPVPYTTMPAKYDPNLAFLNCPSFMAAYPSLMTSQPASMKRFSGLLSYLDTKVGFNISQVPPVVYSLYDVYTSQISLGIPLPEDIQEVFPEIEVAAGQAIKVVFGDERYIGLQAGVLLQEFYNYAAKIQAGEDTQRFRLFSAHDYNVFSFLSVTQVEFPLRLPKYGSAFALELRRVVKSGQYVVVPVYLSSPGEEVSYFQVAGCGVPCDYDQFVKITSKNAMDVDAYRSKCGFTEDVVVDDASIG